ncbi:MAG: septal ring lytic transglycosylase RlpA family protein [Calditrichaeota bacterium]|nr:MAG: septal ring lytic transglycosylase RlpA family protein [Calditrichota bacterium]
MLLRFSSLFLLIFCAYFLKCSTTGQGRLSGQGTSHLRESLRKERIQPASQKVIYGEASYYADEFHGRKTANGETFDMHGLTAAHRSWPFGTLCLVTNLNNDKSVIVRINDRGPFVAGRIMDLSKGAAEAIGGILDGIIKVKIEILEMPSE